MGWHLSLSTMEDLQNVRRQTRCGNEGGDGERKSALGSWRMTASLPQHRRWSARPCGRSWGARIASAPASLPQHRANASHASSGWCPEPGSNRHATFAARDFKSRIRAIQHFTTLRNALILLYSLLSFVKARRSLAVVCGVGYARITHGVRYTRGLVARVAESVDAADLKFASLKLYGFESRPGHHGARISSAIR